MKINIVLLVTLFFSLLISLATAIPNPADIDVEECPAPK